MKNLQTFQADSMPAALAEVRRALGENAIILHTRTVERRAVLGLGRRRRRVEVIAASANFDLPASGAAVMLPRGSRKDAAAVVAAQGAALHMPVATDETTQSEVRRLRAEIDELKKLVGALPLSKSAPSAHAAPPLPEELRRTRLSLLASAVAGDIADELIARLQHELTAEQLRDPAAIRLRLAGHIAALLPAGGGIDFSAGAAPGVVVLVGTTGVGKTTTIAKLAADCCLRHGRRAGIITLDAQRVGADEPLRAYAEILGVPLHTAASAHDLSAARATLTDCDLVLIDTPGCNPADASAVHRLQTLLVAAGESTVHLVLPANAGRAELLRAVEGFSPVAFSRVIFTRLDESVGCGVMLECLRRTRARLSYVTDGPNIAENIAIGAPRRLTERILAGVGPGGAEGRRA